MAKRTGFKKVIGRPDYKVTWAINKIKVSPFQEVVIIHDFSK